MGTAKWWVGTLGSSFSGELTDFTYDYNAIADSLGGQELDDNKFISYFVNPNVCVSDKFRMAGPELSDSSTQWNEDVTHYSNYCCPNIIGTDPCPFFNRDDLNPEIGIISRL